MLQTEKKNRSVFLMLNLQGAMACWCNNYENGFDANNCTDGSVIMRSEDKPTEASILRILEGAMGFTEYDEEEKAHFENSIYIDLDRMINVNRQLYPERGNQFPRLSCGDIEYVTDVNWQVRIYADEDLLKELQARLNRPIYRRGLGLDHCFPSRSYNGGIFY